MALTVPIHNMVTVKLCSASGEEHDITVARDARLREVQGLVCRLYRKPFPATKVCLAMGSRCYDEFLDSPFVNCDYSTVMSVVFIKADDPYFYGLDLKGKRRPHQPAAELEMRLSSSPLCLPPPIVFD